MTEAHPSCTVAIPVYMRRDARFNFVALESALMHAPADAEILVIDDCSPECTWTALQRYKDPRLRLVRNASNLGLFGNFNRCLELARAPIVRILCTDDSLEPGSLGAEVTLLQRHPGAVVLSTYGLRVHNGERELGGQADHLAEGCYSGLDAIAAVLWFKSHYGLNPLNYPSGVLLVREAALRAGGFDTTMRMAGDIDLFLRMLRDGDLLVRGSIGCRIGVHDDQEGSKLARSAMVADEDFEIVARHRELLEASGVYDVVMRQFGGVALGLACRCLLRGDTRGARSFLASGHAHGVSTTQMVLALGKLVALRCVLRIGDVRLTHNGPAGPL